MKNAKATESARTAAMSDQDDQDRSRRRSLIALAVVVAIFVVSWILVQELYQSEKLQDCLLSGRTNCAPIATPPR